ncbi:MAG: tRNA (adenosine(37)-N6)-threonylcarbamoyltransferase complex ATPase subunit type 1 TsaE [Candidatus Zixiibacteriota bacterium]
MTNSADQTFQAGRRLAESLRPGDVVSVSGELGAGKTVFCKGIATGLGVTDGDVSSPSFAIVNEYSGRFAVLHADFYRLSGPDEVIRLGWEEYLERDAIVLVEWPEMAPGALPHDRVRVRIEFDQHMNGQNRRRIQILRDGQGAEQA